MDEWEEIVQLARSLCLPPLELVEDECPKEVYDEKQIQNVAGKFKAINTRLDNCPIDQIRPDFSQIGTFLILCGENSVVAGWNRADVVESSRTLLAIILRKSGVKKLNDLLREPLISSLIEELKPKLMKDKFKQHPGAVQCFLWLTVNTMNPHVDDAIGHFLPVILRLLDDYQPKYRKIGLEAIHHVLSEATRSVLKHLGWAAVICDALKPACFRDVGEITQVYICMDLCLKVMCPDPQDASQWLKIDQYDVTLNQLLQAMEMEQIDESRLSYLEVLDIYIRSMKMKVLRFVPPICAILDNYITEKSSLRLCTNSINVLELLLQRCWPCKTFKCIETIMWIIFKAHFRGSVVSASDPAENTQDLKQSLDCCISTFRKISPSHVPTLQVMMDIPK